MGKSNKTVSPTSSPREMGHVKKVKGGFKPSSQTDPKTETDGTPTTSPRRRKWERKTKAESKKNEVKHKMIADKPVVQLHWMEKWLYILGWTSAALCSVYHVFEASGGKYEELRNEYLFQHSWSIIGRKKDISNFEWSFWTGWFVDIWPWFVGHLILGQVVRWTGFQYRRGIFLLYSLSALIGVMGPKLVGLIVGHCVISYVIAWPGYILLTWFNSFLLLSTLNFDPFTSWMKWLCGNDPFERHYYLLIFSVAMTNLRYISFTSEWCLVRRARYRQHKIQQIRSEQNTVTRDEEKTHEAQECKHTENAEGENIVQTPCGTRIHEKVTGSLLNTTDILYLDNTSNLKFGLFDMLSYCLYLPFFFTGPTMTYKDFFTQMSKPLCVLTPSKVLWVSLDTVRVIFWAVFCEVTLHYFYFNAIQHDTYMMKVLPLWAVAGIGYCQGQFFMVKYVVLYGLSSNLAKMDQLEPPKGPKCISRIYLYSEMWKSFDRGLYSFMKRHIYIPLGGSQHGFVWQVVASFCCFVFVYYWHGAEDYLLTWTMLNFLGITIEALSAKLSSAPFIVDIEERFMSARMRRRLHAFLSVPLFAMSVIAIFVFFGGQEVGYIYYKRLIIEGWPVSPITIYLALYCFVQTSYECDRWERHKAKGD